MYFLNCFRTGGYLKSTQKTTEEGGDILGKDISVTVRETVIDYSHRGNDEVNHEVAEIAA